MVLQRDLGIVLRTTKLGEADRIIALLTKHSGTIRVVAKGVRKSSSKIGARLETGNVVDVQWNTGRSLGTVIQVETVAANAGRIVANYEDYTAACALVEVTEKLTEHHAEAGPEQFDMLRGALGALAAKRQTSELIVDAFMIRSLSLSGWVPSLTHCANCGDVEGLEYFSVRQGGAVCRTCKSPGVPRVAQDVLAHMQALLEGDWERAEAASAKSKKQASLLLATYLEWHIERRIKSLAHVERDVQNSGS